jgi:hypothetical protein
MNLFSYKMLYLKHLKIGLISILAHFDGLYEEMSEFKFPASFESCRVEYCPMTRSKQRSVSETIFSMCHETFL